MMNVTFHYDAKPTGFSITLPFHEAQQLVRCLKEGNYHETSNTCKELVAQIELIIPSPYKGA